MARRSKHDIAMKLCSEIPQAIIAGSPPISLSLIVGESKCDAKASDAQGEAYVIVAPNYKQSAV